MSTKRRRKSTRRVERRVSNPRGVVNSEGVNLADTEGPSLPAPAQHLPIEIISEILAYIKPTAVPPPTKCATLPQWRAFFSDIFPLNYAVVCRAWRLATLQTPSLWTSLFVKVHSPSSRALKVMRSRLEMQLGRSARSRHGIAVGIVFSGKFEFERACDAISPLLSHQRRWTAVEVEMCMEGWQDVRKDMVLDAPSLIMLHTLRLNGGYWDTRAIARAEQENVVNPEINVQLPELRILHLIDFRRVTRMPFVSVARNLEELVMTSIDWNDSGVQGAPIQLERLKKLVIHDKTRRAHSLYAFTCPNLEELCMNGLKDGSFRQLRNFIHNSAASLQTLKLFTGIYNNYSPSEDDLVHLRETLITQRYMKVLFISGALGAISETLLADLMSVSEDGMFDYCPILEDLYLGKILGHEVLYAELVNRRWNSTPRTIRKIHFHNCETFHRRGPPNKRLFYIPAVVPCINEGLKLELCFSDDTNTGNDWI